MNHPLRNLFAPALERKGYAVLCSEPGADGLRLLDSEDFLGMVSDMHMRGGIDGAQVHVWVAQHRPELASRFVFTTGDIENDHTLAALRKTGAPCIEKPFLIEQLISRTMGKAA